MAISGTENGHANGHANGLSDGANGSNYTNGHSNGLSRGTRDNPPHGQDGTITTKQGYFLDDLDYSNLDLSMFTFSAAKAEQVNPNHRLVLEVVREAFESAGVSEWRGKNIGAYVGLFTEDWQELATNITRSSSSDMNTMLITTWNASPDLTRLACTGQSAGGNLAVQSGLLFSELSQIKLITSMGGSLSTDIPYCRVPGLRKTLGRSPPPAGKAKNIIRTYVRNIKPQSMRTSGNVIEMWDFFDLRVETGILGSLAWGRAERGSGRNEGVGQGRDNAT
ncbi:Mycolipanoate synthase [Ciborinia camelliae]|nr:Mycolipanoate synthase [Ciborinia camelliae]